MTRIITHNDTRYRTTGTYADSGKNGLCEKTGSFVDVWASSRPRRVGDRVEVLQPLPFIPDWPGHRPEQYLTDDPNAPVKPGDLCAHIYWDGRVILEHASPGGCISTLADLHSDMKPADCKTYLISRADPSEDA